MTGLARLDERGVHTADRRAGLTNAQLATLARNSFDACSADDADKQRWKAEVDGYAAGGAPSPR
jgi:adenosine deaminase